MIIVMPMAGEGQRFADAGFADPKPFIDVHGKPMVQVTWEGLPEPDRWVFVCRAEHRQRLVGLVDDTGLGPDVRIVTVDGTTAGPACTALLARDHVDDAAELIIADCDQRVPWNAEYYLESAWHSGAAGAFPVFASGNPAYSYARLGPLGMVTEVVEKRAVSPYAIAGTFYFREARLCWWAIERMIAGGRSAHGEYYVGPSYNELIAEGHGVMPYHVSQIYNMGTPEHLSRVPDVAAMDLYDAQQCMAMG